MTLVSFKFCYLKHNLLKLLITIIYLFYFYFLKVIYLFIMIKNVL